MKQSEYYILLVILMIVNIGMMIYKHSIDLDNIIVTALIAIGYLLTLMIKDE